MKKTFYFVASLLLFCFVVNAQKTYTPKYWSIAHANSLMARFPDPDNIPFKAWSYSQGYVLTGIEKLATMTGDPRYFEYIKRYADQRVDSAGNIASFRGDHLDDYMAGAVIVDVFRRNGDPKLKLAADRMRQALAKVSRNSDGGFWHADSIRWKHRSYEMWIDGVFMGQMFLLRYGKYVGDTEYCYDEATKQILILAKNCRKDNTGLFYHGYDENKNAPWASKETGLSPEVWSEGLGWYALILVETLKFIPENHPNRPAVVKILQELAEGLRKTQDAKTGLWYQVVDKGDRPDNWLESSGSGMFVHMIQTAVDMGLISKEVYEPVAKKGFQGLLTKVKINREYGLIDIYDACDGLGVQKSYADYINFPKRINAKETMGSFLWAALAIEKPTSAVTAAIPLPLKKFVSADLGSPELKGSSTVVKNGFDIVAGGKDIWGSNDQFQYAFIQKTGNFDIMARIDSMSMPQLYTKAGIMVREELTGNSRHLFAQVFADNQPRNNNTGGYEFLFRAQKGGKSKAIYPPKMLAANPEFPVYFPNVWIRLKRVGNDYTYFGSTDGKNWKVYTFFTMQFPETVYVGLALTSHIASKTALAKFRDIAEVK